MTRKKIQARQASKRESFTTRPTGKIVAVKGDWIIGPLADGNLSVMSDKEFREAYKLPDAFGFAYRKEAK